jgi:hypothetical protein
VDFDRLDIQEVSMMSKLIRILGTPAAPDELEKLINVCEGAATMYRKALAASRAASRGHGE